MSLADYEFSKRIDPEISFYGLIMAAMRRADTQNLRWLKHYWPDTWNEMQERYNSVGGIIEGDDE